MRQEATRGKGEAQATQPRAPWQKEKYLEEAGELPSRNKIEDGTTWPSIEGNLEVSRDAGAQRHAKLETTEKATATTTLTIHKLQHMVLCMYSTWRFQSAKRVLILPILLPEMSLDDAAVGALKGRI